MPHRVLGLPQPGLLLLPHLRLCLAQFPDQRHGCHSTCRVPLCTLARGRALPPTQRSGLRPWRCFPLHPLQPHTHRQIPRASPSSPVQNPTCLSLPHPSHHLVHPHLPPSTLVEVVPATALLRALPCPPPAARRAQSFPLRRPCRMGLSPLHPSFLSLLTFTP